MISYKNENDKGSRNMDKGPTLEPCYTEPLKWQLDCITSSIYSFPLSPVIGYKICGSLERGLDDRSMG